jgi:hypothetical protein
VHQYMELVISSEDFQDLILTRLDLMEDLDSNQGAGNANPKTGGQAPLGTNYEGEKTNFGPLFYCCVLFTFSLLIFSPKPGPNSPSLGYFKDNSNIVLNLSCIFPRNMQHVLLCTMSLGISWNIQISFKSPSVLNLL